MSGGGPAGKDGWKLLRPRVALVMLSAIGVCQRPFYPDSVPLSMFQSGMAFQDGHTR